MCFEGVEGQELVVELDPVVPVQGAQAHCDVVFGAVAEGPVGEGLGVLDGPVGVGVGGRAGEGDGVPYWGVGVSIGVDYRERRMACVPPGSRSGALKERFSRLGVLGRVLGWVLRVRMWWVIVTASQVNVMNNSPIYNNAFGWIVACCTVALIVVPTSLQ